MAAEPRLSNRTELFRDGLLAAAADLLQTAVGEFVTLAGAQSTSTNEAKDALSKLVDRFVSLPSFA